MKKNVIFKIICVALSVLTLCFAFTACGDKDIAIIGGADGPTKIIVGDNAKNNEYSLPVLNELGELLEIDFEALKVRLGYSMNGPSDGWRSVSEGQFYLNNIETVECYMNTASSPKEMYGIKDGKILFSGVYGVSSYAFVKDFLSDEALGIKPASYEIDGGNFVAYIWKINNGYLSIVAMPLKNRNWQDHIAYSMVQVKDLELLSFIPSEKDIQTDRQDNEALTDTDTVKVRFDMECDGKDIGSFTMMLYPEYAPITVENFVGLVQEGFYDGVTFHRIAEGYNGPFVAQGGDPDGDGRTNPGQKQIKGEFAANGVDNPLADSHVRGVVSMARTNDYNSASSQFFNCYNDSYGASLNGQYAALGKVIEGMEVVDSFLEVERDYNDKPLEDIIITKAEIIK